MQQTSLPSNADERDPSVPVDEPPTAPEEGSLGTMPVSLNTAAHSEAESVQVAPHSQVADFLLGDSAPESSLTLSESCAEKVAELTLDAQSGADSLLGGSPTPDSCAEKVAELSLDALPAAAQLTVDKAAVSKMDLLILGKVLGVRELQVQLQAYGPESELCCLSGDDNEDDGSGGSEASDGAVSDSCSEEQEDYDAARKAVGKEAVGTEARPKKVYSLWRPFA